MHPFLGEARSNPFKLKHDHPEVAYVLYARAHPARWRWLYGVEYDVAYSGNFSNFVRAHATARPDTDLLAYQVGWREPGCWHWTRMSAEAKRYVRDATAALYGPLVRYSNRLLLHLGRSYDRGLVGYCEVIQASLCNATPWCTLANFSHERVAPTYEFAPTMTFATFEALAPLLPERAFHPVKPTSSKESKVQGVRLHAHRSPDAAFAPPVAAQHEAGAADAAAVARPALDAERAIEALCLAANPHMYAHGWWDCPIGCPRETQRLCDARLAARDARTQREARESACLWDFPNETQYHWKLAPHACKQLCKRSRGAACPVSVFSQRAHETCLGNDATRACDAPVNEDALLFGLGHFASASDELRAGRIDPATRAQMAARLAEYKDRHRLLADVEQRYSNGGAVSCSRAGVMAKVDGPSPGSKCVRRARGRLRLVSDSWKPGLRQPEYLPR